MRKLYTFGLIVVACIFIGQAYAEEFTMSTYYPAPFGVYREMRAKRMAIGDTYYDGGTYPWDEDGLPPAFGEEIHQDADLVVNGNVGIGTASPGEKLDVAGNIITESLIEDTKTAIEGYDTNPNNDLVDDFELLDAITDWSNNEMSDKVVNVMILLWRQSLSISGLPGSIGVSNYNVFTSNDTTLYSAYFDGGKGIRVDNGDMIVSNGNVGIGTTYPTAKLTVNGDLYYSGNEGGSAENANPVSGGFNAVTMVSLDMGNVTAGDRILAFATAYVVSSSASDQEVGLGIAQESGDATIETFNDLTAIMEEKEVKAGAAMRFTFGGPIKVTADGMLTLRLYFGALSGSNMSVDAGNAQLYAFFTKKQ